MAKLKFLYSTLIFAALFVSPTVALRATAQVQSEIKYTLSNLHVNAFSKDKTGYMWIATARGLCRYNGYEYVHYFHNPDDERSINSDFVINLFLDSNDQMWVTTDKGVCKYNYETNDFTRCHLAGDPKREFSEYDFIEFQGQLIMGGTSGINKID